MNYMLSILALSLCLISIPWFVSSRTKIVMFVETRTLALGTKVMIVPGIDKWFGDGAKDHVRISFATSTGILNEAFDRIESIL